MSRPGSYAEGKVGPNWRRIVAKVGGGGGGGREEEEEEEEVAVWEGAMVVGNVGEVVEVVVVEVVVASDSRRSNQAVKCWRS